MPKQNQYLTMKFNSDRLKKFGYDINLSIEEAIEYKEMISTFENQIIDSILDITKRESNQERVNHLRYEIKKIKKMTHSKENSKKINTLQRVINKLMFVPEYITIKIIHKSHYAYMFENGVKINGITFRRFNASASQARVNTVLFVSELILPELTRRTDNGRNLYKELVPAKLNAYRGLYSSSRFKVSTPRFCVVKDFESPSEFYVNFVTETDNWNEDDELEVRKVERMFNRFDGQGLIDPDFAKQWADELELDYTPSQWCIRAPFLKGNVCKFNFKKWCREINNGDYMVNTIYKDENGKPIKADISKCDMIITESQMKLWDSWDSVEDYNQNCKINNLSWGVTLFSPKEDKNYFFQNYQFMQTLDLNDEGVRKVTERFVNWVKGTVDENPYYAMLFLLGLNNSEEKFIEYVNKGETDWIRAIILEPKLIKSKYFRNKIYQLIKKKIENACLGQIIVPGNFQVLCSDPYAQMEAIFGKEVKGLLGEKEYYSKYWNEKDIEQVSAARSPLTYRSEHLVLNLKNDEKLDYWFGDIYTGIILNVHGAETAVFAGADFDHDILSTTSDPSIIKGVYQNELPVIYKEPKGEKEVVNDEMLYKADLFSFNSIIGGLTNKSTSGYALLAQLEEDTEEYDATLKRIKTITKAQSAQIDKTKIGREVKGIVGKWVNYQPAPRDEHDNILPEDEEVKKKRLFENSIMLKKHPYFFTYLYKNTRKKYKHHIKKYETLSLQKLGITLEELKGLKRKNTQQEQFIEEMYSESPVIESNCVMNKICWRIESVNFQISKLLKNDTSDPVYEFFMGNETEFNKLLYKKVVQQYLTYKKEVRNIMKSQEGEGKSSYNERTSYEINLKINELKRKMTGICSNNNDVLNYLIHYFYADKPDSDKDLLWKLYGKEMVDNLKNKKNSIVIPIKDENGEMEYLEDRYTLKEVAI